MVRTISGKKIPIGNDNNSVSMDDVAFDLSNDNQETVSAKDNAVLQRQMRLARNDVIKSTGLSMTGRDLNSLRDFYLKVYGIKTGDVIIQRRLFEDFVKEHPDDAQKLLVEMKSRAI